MRLPLIYSKSSSFSRCFEFAGNCILVLAGGRQIGGKHNIYIYIVILLLIEIYFDSLGFFPLDSSVKPKRISRDVRKSTDFKSDQTDRNSRNESRIGCKRRIRGSFVIRFTDSSKRERKVCKIGEMAGGWISFN